MGNPHITIWDGNGNDLAYGYSHMWVPVGLYGFSCRFIWVFVGFDGYFYRNPMGMGIEFIFPRQP